MLAENKFRSFAPVRGVLPAVLDEARRVTVNLGAALALVIHASLPSRFAGADRDGSCISAPLHRVVNGPIGLLVHRLVNAIGVGII